MPPFGLTKSEYKTLCHLSTPAKIQDYLDRLPFNHEKGGETHRSVRRVLRDKTAHCIEGALVAAASLMIAGEEPLLMDLVGRPPDVDHVIALYRRNGYWGAVSKTNHATIRFRDPVYKTLRELALSYFHEWFLDKGGKKTLESFSKPLRLAPLDPSWLTGEEELWWLDTKVNSLPHFPLVPPKNRRFIRAADRMERAAGKLVEWPR